MKRLLSLVMVALIVVTVGCAAQPAATSAPAPVDTGKATTAPATATPAPATAKKFTMGLVPPALVSPFYIFLADTAKASAAKNPNLELTVVAPAVQTDVEQQVKIIEDLIEKKVDLIAVGSSSWTAITPVLQKAREAGVEVVLVDRVIPIEGVDAVSMLGSDEIEGGEIVGEFVAKTLNGKGKVAIISGVAGSYHSERRTQGFNNVMAKYPDIEVVTNQPANYERALGMTTAENILQAHKDLDLIWCLNDNMALGALAAVEAAGRQDKVKVIGYNGDKEARESVKAGKMLATACSQPAMIATAIVEEVVPLLMEGKRSEVKPAYPVHVVLATKDNVDQVP